MAGIGFEIRKMLAPASWHGTLRAYAYAGIISSGPWIISIVSIILLNALLQPLISESERTLFSTIVTHAYALALILTGALQFVLNRYAADRLSARDRMGILPSCVAALVLTAFLSLGAGGVLFGLLMPEPVGVRLGAISLFVYVSLIFVCANYLGVLQNYRGVVFGFACGYAVGCAAAWFGATRWGVTAALAGFAAGHLVLFVLLFGALRRELSGGAELASWSFLGHFRRYPGLALCGFLYNAGIWIDKILFWRFSEHNIRVSGALRASLEYDLSIYLSLLSIVPGMAVFFLRLETDFAACFERFFDATNRGGTLGDIEARKADMVDSLRSGFAQLVSVQAVVTLSLLIYGQRIAEWLGIGAIQAGIFRVTLVGAFLLILFLAMLTILFYLDDRRGALVSCAVFALGNAGLSFATLRANEAWYGFGFVVAAGVAMFIAAWRVNARLARFEYRVFAAAGA
ncbi:MAG: exopolysaccharide Pel transporter PelG [Verrucomicrobiae bacterium]|nr:exopolysaccharide Pel transporter PelG [Verrucomicrobiae bacterium]MCP5539356.1 exopolysaccharide Pel transporter PelG [Akkermansiaceae bacterium]MCP5549741.1 exopolysaccharide Pel transporter PelG [Akkermansiaceae bacterium]